MLTNKPVPRKHQTTWRRFDEVRRSTCGNCSAGCGVKGFLKDGVLVDLFGDEDHPANKGSFCPKGLLSWVLLGHPDRICYPRIRDSIDQPFRACSWSVALDKISEALEAHRSGKIVAHADESASFGYRYGASLFAQLAGLPFSRQIIGPDAFNTNPFISRGRLANMFGVDGDRLLMNSQRDWAFSRCILVVGADLGTTDPITLGPLVDVRDRGGSLIVIDSKTTITAVKASYHIRVNPGTEAAFLAAVIRQLLAKEAVDHSFLAETVCGVEILRQKVEDFTLAAAVRICGVLATDIETVADVIGRAQPMQVMCGDWFSRSRLDDELLGLSAALVLLRGSVGVPGGGLNVLNASPFKSRQNELYHLENLIREESVSVLFCHGNPAARFEGGKKVRDDMSRIPLIVQMGGFNDETSSYAHIQLPLTTWVEEAGLTYGNNGRAVQWRQPLADPRDASLPALDIWFDIMDRCKLEMPSFASRRKDELARAVADEVLAENDLTSGIRVSDLTPKENLPGGILWPSIDAKDNQFEDDRFGRGDVRGKNILFRRHRGYGKSAHRFPAGQALIDISNACHRSLESYAASEFTSCDGELKLIVTVGVDFIPGWSGGRPTPGLAASLPVVRIHPETGLHHEVITGSIVTVFNENGCFVGRAELSLTVDRDVVWCIETPGHDARRTVAFELFDVPPNGEPRRPFAFVKLCAQSPRREDADAMMLGR